MPYPYEQIFAADESSPEKVASNGVVTIFAPGDPDRTPLTITTLDGLPLSNPMQVNDAGFGPAFMHATFDQVAWTGAGLSGLFVSYKGMKDEAVAARMAAEAAAQDAGAPTDAMVDRGIARADIPGKVAEAVAADEIVAAAAAELAQSSAGLARKTDPGMPAVAQADSILAAFRDALGYLTWLSARSSDGGPTDTAMQHLHSRLGVGPQRNSEYLFAVTDADRRLTDLAIRASDGQFDDFVIDRLRPRILAGYEPPAVAQHAYADTKWVDGSAVRPERADKARVISRGSSSTQGIDPYLKTLFESKGASYSAGGKGSERVQEVAARLGSIPAVVTVAGGVVPASGSVDVTTSNITLRSALRSYSGKLAGVPGILSYRATPPSYIFTRNGTGTPVQIPDATPFIPDDASYRDATLIWWAGKNNMGDLDGDLTAISYTDQTFDWLVPLVKRFLILGHFADQGTSATSTERARIVNANTSHKARYGRMFIDVYEYLASPQLWLDTGITPTAQDLADQAAYVLPTSISMNSGHFNASGYTAITGLINSRMTELGWY